MEGRFDFCSARSTWKCSTVGAKSIFDKTDAENGRDGSFIKHSSSLVGRIVPWRTGKHNYNVHRTRTNVILDTSYILINMSLDFSLQDTWLDVIVWERTISSQNIFDHFFCSVNVNNNNLVVMNELYSIKKQGNLRNQDLLLYSFFSKFEKKDLIIKVHANSTIDEDMGKKYTVTNLIWSDVIKLSVLNPGYLISLRGSIFAELKNIGNNVSSELKAYWTADVTVGDSLPRYSWSIYCFGPFHSRNIGLYYSLKYFLIYHKIKYDAYEYYFNVLQFRDTYTLYKTRQKTKRLGSWNEANSVCKAKGGYLPILTGKEEQDEIIRYLKLMKCTPTVNILFIGLTVNLVRYFYIVA